MSRLARGEPVLGLRSNSAGVVYIAAEGAAGVRLRIQGLREATGTWSDNTSFIGAAPNLTDQADVDRLAARLGKIRAKFQSRGIRLGAVVVDTMSASIPGADENAAKEMSPILTRLQELAATLDLCVIVVAHVGKDADRGIRGWSGMFANADGVVRVMPHDEGDLRIVTVQKAKDAEAGQRHAFALKVVNLGLDDDGDPKTTCVVDWQESPPSGTRAGKRARTKQHANRTAILTALGRLEDRGQLRPLNGVSALGSARGAGLRDLMEAAFDAGLGGPEPDGPAEVKRWKDNSRKAFQNHLSYAVQDGVLAQENGLVWRCLA